MDHIKSLAPMADELYRYLNFDQIQNYQEMASSVEVSLS
jgi:aconitase B